MRLDELRKRQVSCIIATYNDANRIYIPLCEFVGAIQLHAQSEEEATLIREQVPKRLPHHLERVDDKHYWDHDFGTARRLYRTASALNDRSRDVSIKRFLLHLGHLGYLIRCSIHLLRATIDRVKEQAAQFRSSNGDVSKMTNNG